MTGSDCRERDMETGRKDWGQIRQKKQEGKMENGEVRSQGKRRTSG